ncbi:AlpA family phage regulatory protein [Xanthomonas campestris]|uniref:helix-turn-helix transcriptional regulator n=1 Tax=Xanthomonas campestris TaxID=339 RepID=UPI002B228CF5|nr:AlpA family phage regulatory protein [Xanthomonas campestris]MEB1653813.1 AlpA family phage regulatory protein [Xanthomonas campestris pv. campestris]MEA9551693.1 AlpA family phage regulatory protein [Xanthomonas campestris]MEB1863604.1 AlpA family phage regulatory protein [Xanthomonas campestris pv. campestris]MEB1892143.1 AlpA family phage regulatory protein [Xanthomonas campestris pv. campestris]MEB2012547.1 AlpA family phage regulatory protein [Xanthomonas campestris pv. campestris]
MPETDTALRLLPIKDVRAKVGLSPATIYRQMQAGKFPKPHKVCSRSLWLSTQIDEWIIEQTNSTSVGQDMGQAA